MGSPHRWRPARLRGAIARHRRAQSWRRRRDLVRRRVAPDTPPLAAAARRREAMACLTQRPGRDDVGRERR